MNDRSGKPRVRVAVCAAILATATGACSATSEPDGNGYIGVPHRLVSIDGNALPFRYYNSPDGSYYVVSDSGCIIFEVDRRVAFVTHRSVYLRGHTEPDSQVGRERVKFREDSTLGLSIARSETRSDSGRVYGDDIWVWFTHEGLRLGRWIYRRDPAPPPESVCGNATP